MLTHPVHRALTRGILVGALAGSIVALGDFGASWLYLTMTSDRVELLVRLVGLQFGAGAVLGALGGGLVFLLERWTLLFRPERAPAFYPLPIVLLASPLLYVIVGKLLSGGFTRTLEPRLLWFAGSLSALVLATYGGVRLARSGMRRALAASPRHGLAAAALAYGLAVVIAKADQHVLPKLYDHVHAVLSAGTYVTTAAAVWLLSVHYRPVRDVFAKPSLGYGALAVALAAFFTSATTLDDNPNVHVALYEPRAAVSRSLLMGVEPLIARSEKKTDAAAIARARADREARRRRSHAEGLPVVPDAHVVLITIDALRADHLGAYGYERGLTPNLDAMGRRGAVFERAYASAPHSSYSLTSLMTSEYVHETVDMGMEPPEVTLAGSLARAGYRTAAFFTQGIFHTEGERLARYRDSSFDFALHDHRDLRCEAKTDRVLEEVDRLAKRGEPPSFLWVHYFDTHEPYVDTSLGTSDVDRYDAEIRNVDRAVGRLLSTLRSRFSKPVIAVVTADHGEEFRDHGGVYHGSTLYDEQVRVPLIVEVPETRPVYAKGTVELVDVAPTLLSLLGLPVPETMRGDDLRPLIAGRADDTGPAFAGVAQRRMVVRLPYKLIADLQFDLFELYDLTVDPGERTNLAKSKGEIVEDLRGEIYAWLDSLPARPDQRDSPNLALEWARIGDRRAVRPLIERLLDENESSAIRKEAAMHLGILGDPSAAVALVSALSADDHAIVGEAAISLGRLSDPRARTVLRHLVFTEDVDVRCRAAVALGRIGDRAAVPGLLDALWVVKNPHDRREAIRLLGVLGDERAVEPLIRILPEFRFRNSAVIALGALRDPRAVAPLLDLLSWERHANIRDSAVDALGNLRSPKAIAQVIQIAREEQEIGSAGRSLLRLGALRKGLVGGADAAGASSHGAVTQCRNADKRSSAGTTCDTRGPRASLSLTLPSRRRNPSGRAVLLARIGRKDASEGTFVELRAPSMSSARLPIDGRVRTYRVEVRLGGNRPSRARLLVTAEDETARLSIDYVLVIPNDGDVVADARVSREP